MFTGIIERVVPVVAVHAAPVRGDGPATRIELRLGDLLDELPHGASIAVNGACLTLAEQHGEIGCFDVIPETLRRTTLERLHPGDRVNVERSLCLGDRIDGHFVQGHVDTRGAVTQVDRAAEWALRVRVDDAFMPLMIPKGSVAIDGVSLTIAAVDESGFTVALIPTTLADTTLGRLCPGDLVNLETDYLARIIMHRLDLLEGRGDASGLTEARLREAGFA